MTMNAAFKQNMLEFLTTYYLDPWSCNEVEAKYYEHLRRNKRGWVVSYGQISPYTEDTWQQGRSRYQQVASKCYCKIKAKETSGAIPLYYLPYSGNAMRKIVLEPRDGDIPANFFITDTMEGCALSIEGPQEAPTVCHLNAVQTKSAIPDDNSEAWLRDTHIRRAQKMVEMVQEDRLNFDDPHRFIKPALKNTILQPEHYRGEYGQGKIEGERSLRAHANGINKKWYQSKKYSYSQTKITSFGIRKNRKWKFYMQKHVMGMMNIGSVFKKRKTENNRIIATHSPPIEIYPDNQNLQFFNHYHPILK